MLCRGYSGWFCPPACPRWEHAARVQSLLTAILRIQPAAFCRAHVREKSLLACVCVRVVQLVWQCTQHTCLSHMYMQCDEVRAGIINRDSV